MSSNPRTTPGEQSAPLTHEQTHLLFPELPYRMRPRITDALEDEQLQGFLRSATLHKNRDREQRLAATFGDRTDAIRRHAASIKQHTLDHLDHYLKQFIDAAEATGARVHFARTADDANRIAATIARDERCTRCVKSKSMVTEEIRLLPALEQAGIETIETDLAEFILQLDRDAPSHIVTAMMHKDRKAVGRAFQRELGIDYEEDPRKLTLIARSHLRSKFRDADLGITGANFLVASTGSLVLCTNEGNGRMCTTMPRVQITIAGIEKLVPTLDHLAVMLKVLTRSSTGQPLTCYTNIVTGRRRNGEIDGPQSLHIILLDNGRSNLLAGEQRELLRCIRCGACLNTCPVYRSIGGHAYGSVYSGPIGAALTPELRGLLNYPDLPDASSLCGACLEACPVMIDIPRHLIRLRRGLVEQRRPGRGERWLYRLWALSQRRVWTYRLAQRLQRLLMRRHKQGFVRSLPGPLGKWTKHRDMPAPAPRAFRDWWAQHQAEKVGN